MFRREVREAEELKKLPKNEASNKEGDGNSTLKSFLSAKFALVRRF